MYRSVEWFKCTWRCIEVYANLYNCVDLSRKLKYILRNVWKCLDLNGSFKEVSIWDAKGNRRFYQELLYTKNMKFNIQTMYRLLCSFFCTLLYTCYTLEYAFIHFFILPHIFIFLYTSIHLLYSFTHFHIFLYTSIHFYTLLYSSYIIRWTFEYFLYTSVDVHTLL